MLHTTFQSFRHCDEKINSYQSMEIRTINGIREYYTLKEHYCTVHYSYKAWLLLSSLGRAFSRFWFQTLEKNFFLNKVDGSLVQKISLNIGDVDFSRNDCLADGWGWGRGNNMAHMEHKIYYFPFCRDDCQLMLWNKLIVFNALKLIDIKTAKDEETISLLTRYLFHLLVIQVLPT